MKCSRLVPEPAELDIQRLSQVDVDAFYGIEIGEWPARIAEVAIWLMDHQMNMRLSEAFGQSLSDCRSKNSRHRLRQRPARRLEKNSSAAECSYVLGNPPFVGKKEQTDEQKPDMSLVFGKVKGAGVLDYVSAWYAKAGEYIQGTRIEVAFVSTNSITQGEQVGILWSDFSSDSISTFISPIGPLHGRAKLVAKPTSTLSSSASHVFPRPRGRSSTITTKRASPSPFTRRTSIHISPMRQIPYF